MVLRPLAVALLVAAVAAPRAAAAQRVASAEVERAPAEPDSAPLAHAARAAQAAFERDRRLRLPWEDGAGGGAQSPRAVHIGRMVYWPDDDDDETPPADPTAVRSRRGRLIALLDSVAAAIPGDRWVAGQRVRYLIEAGRADEAIAATRDCAAERAWCLRLAGYALHLAGRFAAADSAFGAALAAMPDSTRCRWLRRAGDALEDDLHDRWSRADCRERESLLARVWRSGAPLYLVGADELRTAILTRLTRAELEADAESPRSMRWGDDLAELTVRYGWSAWFTRSQPPIGSLAEPSIVGHDRGRGLTLEPDAIAIDSGWKAPPSSWTVDRPTARLRYATDYARTIDALPHQLAVFARGDSAVIVVAYDWTADTSVHDHPVEAGLFAVDGDGTVRGTSVPAAAARGTLSLGVPAGRYVVSVEALDRGDRVAARARYGLGARAADGSRGDVLLLGGGDPLPASLDAALARALTSDRVRRSEPIALYWELRPSTTPTVNMTLTLEPLEPTGMVHALARRLGLAGDRHELRLSWRDQRRDASTVEARALALDVSRLAPGRYELRLVSDTPGAQRVEARRTIELLR